MEPSPHPLVIYTIGHSNHSENTFISLLEHFGIEIVMDIRSWPVSRRFPHFDREQLTATLERIARGYIWEKDLGGKRSVIPGCEVHTALASPQLRAYVHYLQSVKAQKAIERLKHCAATGTLALMCAEGNPEHCHRYYLADALIIHHGVDVLHITDMQTCAPHIVSAGVRRHQGCLIYSKPEQLKLL